MQVQINYGDVEVSPALTDHVQDRVDHAMRHFNSKITRVEVHLRDDKQKRRGEADARCVMEARPAGLDPITVTQKDEDIYTAVTRAAEKLARAVQHRLDRRAAG